MTEFEQIFQTGFFGAPNLRFYSVQNGL